LVAARVRDVPLEFPAVAQLDEAALARAILETSDDAIVSKDLNGIVTSWNRAAEQMFGYTAEEMIGASIRTIIPADRQQEEDEVLARIRRGDRVNHFETVRQRKDGTFVPISLTVSPVFDKDGRIVGASKIARDISERVRLETIAREQLAVTQKLGEVGAKLSSTLDRDAIVQRVTDVATELTTAEFGAFFYNVNDPESGEASVLTPFQARRRKTSRISRNRARPRSLVRPSAAKASYASTMSRRIPATGAIRRITASPRAKRRCAATSPCR